MSEKDKEFGDSGRENRPRRDGQRPRGKVVILHAPIPRVLSVLVVQALPRVTAQESVVPTETVVTVRIVPDVTENAGSTNLVTVNAAPTATVLLVMVNAVRMAIALPVTETASRGATGLVERVTVPHVRHGKVSAVSTSRAMVNVVRMETVRHVMAIVENLSLVMGSDVRMAIDLPATVNAGSTSLVMVSVSRGATSLVMVNAALTVTALVVKMVRASNTVTVRGRMNAVNVMNVPN